MASILTKLLGSSSLKSVLVINFDHEYNGVNYTKTLSDGLSCVFCAWEDLSFVDGAATVNGRPLSTFSFVLFGTVGSHGATYIAALECVKLCGVPYFSYGKSPETNSKTLQTVCFKQAGVPHPKTVIQVAKADDADELISKLGLPIVTKIIDGSQGKGISKHDTKAALVKELKERAGQLLIMQEALTAACDYRAFFIYGELLYVIKRSATKKGEFRHNLSLGGKFEKVELPPAALEIAKAAQRSMSFDASGVDLLQDELSGRWYVLEVNSAPQFIEPAFVLNKLINIIKSKT